MIKTGNLFIDIQNDIDECARRAAQRHRDDVVIMEKLKRVAYDGDMDGRRTPMTDSFIAYEVGIVRQSGIRAAAARAESTELWP